MKLLEYSIFLLLLFLFWIPPVVIRAESAALGNFSESDFLNQLPPKIVTDINGSDYDLSRLEISGWLKEKTDLIHDPEYSSEIETINFCSYKKSLLCRLTFPYKNEGHIQKKSLLTASDDSIKKFLKDLSRLANRDPENAKLTMENGKISIFSLSRAGTKLDEERSLETVKYYLAKRNFSDTLNLPFSEIKPEITTENIDNMGITSLIGEGRSNFRGSPKNRIYNINVASDRFNGILIKPKEEFSFVKVLGEVDADHGYLPELVIKKDKTEPEFGGGICQVSTTAFRAAINSGLEITARRNHAYPVSYYNPQGMDATVYIPRPDLRFINNTPGYILIQTKISGTELVFDFYGTDDGRKINIIGPKVLEKNPDGSMKTVFTQQVFDKDGRMTIEDIFNSAYDSPDKYPHPTDDTLTKKPKDWSEKEWEIYQKAH